MTPNKALNIARRDVPRFSLWRACVALVRRVFGRSNG